MKRDKTKRLSKADENILKEINATAKLYEAYLKINDVPIRPCELQEPREASRAWNYPLTLTMVGKA